MAADKYDTGLYETALAALGVHPNGTAPRCEHAGAINPVPPQATVCRDCQDGGTAWLGLLACLTCGWVACSNDSPEQHARAHYEETSHPIADALESGLEWRWCYIHSRVV
jgi:uncharacterized UBP type Zn finger protein